MLTSETDEAYSDMFRVDLNCTTLFVIYQTAPCVIRAPRGSAEGTTSWCTDKVLPLAVHKREYMHTSSCHHIGESIY